MSDDRLADLWRFVAEAGIGDDAPVYRAIAHAVADDPGVLDVARAAPPETHHPNHLFAAVRYLLLSGVEDELAGAYDGRDEARAVELFGRFVRDQADAILEILQTRRTQTNEVGRVGVIAPTLRHVAERAGRRLALLDVGASAGLNLLVDRIGCDYGTFHTAPDSRLSVSTELETPMQPFLPADLRIGWRGGLDRAPIDLDDEAAARWLLACVWPEQPERIARLEAAIELARSQPWTVERGDAVSDLAAAMAAIPDDHQLVVLTSWVVFYLALDQRAGFEAALAALGRPVSWISFEHPGVVDVPTPDSWPDIGVDPSAIGLIHFDGGDVARTFLGWAHPHGRWLDWHARR